MRQWVTFFVLLCLLGPLSVGRSADNLIPNIPKTVVLEETGEILTLRGVATHKAFFQNTFLAAFYSLDITKNAKEALSDTGPKRMWFYFSTSFNDSRAYWEKAIRANNSPTIITEEQITISQFLKMIDSPLREGDTLVLDYMPNIGTKVIVKGSVKGIIKGNEFYNLILKVWMGRQPPSEKFKKDLFNLS